MAARRRKSQPQPIVEELPPIIEEPQPEAPIDEPLMIEKIDEEMEIEVEEFAPEEQLINFDDELIHYYVYVAVPSLRKRAEPNATSAIVGYITDGGKYQIIKHQDNWGQLADGSWINLDYTRRAN